MKKLLALTLLVSFALASQAGKWKMTQNKHGLLADNTNKMKLTKYVSPGMAGNNIIWDFSELQITKNFEGYVNKAAYEKSYSDVTSSPDVVLKEFKNQFYFKNTKNQLELHSVAVNDKVIINYDKPFIKMKYPFGYGDSFTGTYNGEYYSGKLTGQINGTYSVEADGFGTLILPDGVTVEDALRVKTVRYYTKTINNRTYDTEVTTYRWYDKDVRFPILVFIESKYINKDKVNKSYQAAYNNEFIKLNATTDISEGYSSNSFSIFPNPIKEAATIEYSINSKNKVILDIYNISGKKLHTIINKVHEAGAYEHTLQISELDIPAGTYYLKMQSGDNIYTKRLVLQ